MAWPLGAGAGALAFSIIEISIPKESSIQSILVSRSEYEKSGIGTDESVSQKVSAQLAHFMRPTPTFAGFDLRQPTLMGIVNVTPDSFSDGGNCLDSGRALSHALSLREEGAEIIDIGGESTRPGANPVEPDDEIARVVPLVRDLASRGVCVSIDTRHAKVMQAAIDAGARIVNDVTALEGDPDSMHVVAEAGVPVILMHMQGKPQMMQDNPVYGWAPGDVFEYLGGRAAACVDAGIGPEKIALDPGIGFGKNVTHNAEIMNHLGMFLGLGRPLVFGASRKSFIGHMSAGETADKRLPGSLAAALHAIGRGAHILRVHDVAETRQALEVSKHLT
jgi:dihydropteroate synthase